MGYAEDDAARFAEVSAGMSRTLEALCVGYDWANRLVLINISGTDIPMRWVGTPPWKGDRVRVTWAGQQPYCEAVWGSSLGTVQAVASNLATVTGDDGQTYRYPYPFGAAPTAGQRVALSHAHQMVLGRISTDPSAVVVDPPAPPPTGNTGRATFLPIDSGNFMNGAYRDQFVEVSTTRSAAYWYGTQIADTIPDSAIITAASVALVEHWDRVPGTATQMALHTQPTRAGEPALEGSVPVSDSGSFSLLGEYANRLKTGAAFGLGFRKNTGNRRFGPYSESGAITMEWSL